MPNVAWMVMARNSVVAESCRPVSLKFDIGKPSTVRHKQITLGVDEANAVYWLTRGELDLSNKLLLVGPNTNATRTVGGDNKPECFKPVESS